MNRFTFSTRKKKTNDAVPAPPMSKAHKILGATPLSIDPPRSRQGSAEAIGHANNSSSHLPESYDDSPWATMPRKPSVPADPWADESAILTPSLRLDSVGNIYEDGDTSTVLRNKPSSSTIRSWYDRSKMPLAISQQTSASAMAKGLPPKVHKMLDMDNPQQMARPKKPAKLDFSQLLSSRSRRPSRQDGNQSATNSEYTPSILSSKSPNSARNAPRLRRWPTAENLRSPSSESVQPSPGSNNSSRVHTPLNELPGLYEHYEQMSFRHLIDDALEEVEGEEDHAPIAETVTESLDNILLKPTIYRETPRAKSPVANMNQLTPPPPRTLASSIVSAKSDRAPSVSSAHTKASFKAQSFKESNLQSTSMLMLSSDSESDSDEPVPSVAKSSHSITHRRGSGMGDSIASFETGGNTISSSSEHTDRRFSRSTKRTSFAVSSTYLTIPSRRESYAAYFESPTTAPSSSGFSQNSQPAASSRTNSCASSAATWQDRGECLSNKTYDPTSQQGREVSDTIPDYDQDSDYEDDELDYRDTLGGGDQPTPPLSPSSVDFYIRSAHTSIDGPGSNNRFMAVTHQEQMLLSALRLKRQTMRGSKSEAQLKQTSFSQKHNSHTSQATITEDSLEMTDFDFPLPPSSIDATADSNSMTNVPTRLRSRRTTTGSSYHNELDAMISSIKLDSPTTGFPTGFPVEQTIVEDTREPDAESVSPKTQRPPMARKPSHTLFPPAAKIPMTSDEYILAGQNLAALPKLPPARPGSKRAASKNRQPSNGKSPRPNHQHNQSLFDDLDLSAFPLPASVKQDAAVRESVGVPRPDSPISPMAAEELPKPLALNRLQKKMARLSAVGPIRSHAIVED